MRRRTSLHRGAGRLTRVRSTSCQTTLLAAALIATLAAIGGSAVCLAQQAPDVASWVGERVIVRPGAVLLVDGKPIDDEVPAKNPARGKAASRYRVYKVEKVDGSSFLLTAEDSGAKRSVEIGEVVRVARTIEDITDLIDATPEDAENYRWRGLIRLDRDEREKAVADFTEAIQLDPLEAVYHASRAIAWSEERDERAIADFTEAIRLDPLEAIYYTSRGLAWKSIQEYDKAIDDYTEAIRLDPKRGLNFSSRGWTWSSKKEYDKAIADFTEAIRLDPKNGLNFNSRGWTWSRKKEYDKAIADFTEAIRLDPTDGFHFHARGRARADKKDYDEAITDFDEAIRLDPEHSSAYNGRAWMWATALDDKARDGKRAVESAMRACEINEWNRPDDLEALAAGYAETGDFASAVKWEEKAIELLGEDREARKPEFRNRLNLYRDKKPYRQKPSP
ncbi:MAG: tetratricopeptide repeat protein [Paludisphaera borealis]|uniref:tetratricopeptide repeat protein n=1 Tax=Paludisphaera borealis TaxID=1387353 RepID=UPI002844FC11|nr:tetratricopeptide repeat protein [Paludisphaera borealis]MDR3619292.1 tetratricopeptide repeat protein [Paludisphaera borealis]